MYQLYYFPGNANLAPHMLLEEIGAPYELVLVDREKGGLTDPAYLKLNPSGRIPTLIDGELVLSETAAICLHLCDRHPDAHMAPAVGNNARSTFYKWLFYLTNTIQAEMIVYFYPHRWNADEAGAAAVKACAEQRLNGMFDLVEAELASHADQPYLLGADYTAVDPYLFMLARWSRGMQRPARTLPHLGKFLALLAARPAIQRTFAAEGIPAPYY
jgi:glutathione S-transferase